MGEFETERLCPAALLPRFEQSNIAFFNMAEGQDPFCHCEAGPQRIQLRIGKLALPCKDPRDGKFVCGRTREELDN
jgi:hypothetical protein